MKTTKAQLVSDATLREVVGIFDDYDRMQEAIEELEFAGFDRHHISVLGSKKSLQEQFGTDQIASQSLEDNPAAPRAANISQEELGVGQGALVGSGMLFGVVATFIASGGVAIPGAVVATAMVGGGAVGSILAKILGNEYARFFEHQIEQGGILLWVQVPNLNMEMKAQTILQQLGAEDVHVHGMVVSKKGNAAKESASRFFGEAFLKLNLLRETYKTILEADDMLAAKLEKTSEILKVTAGYPEPVSADKRIKPESCLMELVRYTQDMAEEEQRLTDEGPMANSAKSEREAQRYFDINKDLDSLLSWYQSKSRKLSFE